MAPNSDQERRQLDAADRHIAELKQRIARQRRSDYKTEVSQGTNGHGKIKVGGSRGELARF